MNQPDIQGAIAYAKRRMAEELAPELVYHNLAHTFEDVLPAAIRLARLSNLDEEETELLAVAASFHDIGYLRQGSEHERISVEIVRQVLPGFGFTAEQIDKIAGAIMATRLPQSPRDLFEQIMADADLDVLGRPEYWERSNDLRTEWALLDEVMTDEEWRSNQVRMLETHHYFTDAAQRLRGRQKQKNLAEEKRRQAAALRD